MTDTAPRGPAEALPLLDGRRRLLIDVGNTKTALLLAEGESAIAKAALPTASLNEGALRDFLCPQATLSPVAGYSVAASAAQLRHAIRTKSPSSTSPPTTLAPSPFAAAFSA